MKAELINIRPDARKESNGCNGTLEREEWRPVKGYEGLYEVSSFGRVRNPRRNNKLLTLRQDKDGYCTVGLTQNGVMKTRKVHRLVMSAFVPNPDNLPQVNHRSMVRNSNYPDNMEWCDAKYNVSYGNAAAKRYDSRKNGKGWAPLSEDTKKKLSIISRERWEDDDYRKRMCQSISISWTDERRKHQSDINNKRFSNPEARLQISKSSRENWDKLKADPEAYENFCNRYRGENSHWWNKQHSDETRRKLSESRSKKGLISVMQYSMDGEYIATFNSISEAASSVNGKTYRIAEVAQGKRKHHKGFVWKYADPDYIPQKHNCTNDYKKKRTVQMDMDGNVVAVFDSLKEASEKTSIPFKAISSVCTGKRRHCYGYKWKYMSNDENEQQ